MSVHLHSHMLVCVCMCVCSVRYEDPGAVEGLAEALDTRLQVTAGVSVYITVFLTNTVLMILFSSFFFCST